jgi:plasmid stabilization system protein ParE
MAEFRRPAIWSSDARADLSEIWKYYAKVAGQHTADGIVRDIVEACRVLEDHQFAGRARSQRDSSRYTLHLSESPRHILSRSERCR